MHEVGGKLCNHQAALETREESYYYQVKNSEL